MLGETICSRIIDKGSVIDDRSCLGNVDNIVPAVRDALRYDTLAGLDNNHAKFRGMDTSEYARKKLWNADFGGTPLIVETHHKLVGACIQTCRRPIRLYEKERVF